MSATRSASRQSGFSLLELVLVVCVIAVLAALLYSRLEFYQEAAERAAVQQTAAAVRSGLQLQVAGLLLRGRDADIEALAARNPTDFLTDRPPGYVDEPADDESAARLPGGSWYFDARRKELVYLVSYDTRFKPGPDGRKWIRYRIIIEFDDRPGEVPRRQFSAARLVPVNAYAWD